MGRKALVIGNSKYIRSPLDNPSNDANSIAGILVDKGFSVIKLIDLDSQALHSAIHDFCNSSEDAEAALFYFAGHGVECQGQNYLIPCDFDGEDNLAYVSVTLDSIYERLLSNSPKSIKIFILDACRNDSAADLLNVIVGRGEMGSVRVGQARPNIKGDNVLIAFATAPGSTASDQGVRGGNGLYTECLLESISTYGLSIEDMFKVVREKVIEKNGFSQIPWEYSSLTKYFSFDNYDVPGNLIDTITLPFKTLYSSIFSEDSKIVFFSGNGGTILCKKLYDDYSFKITLSDEDIKGECTSLLDNYLLVGDSAGCLNFLDWEGGADYIAKLFESEIYSVSVDADRGVVACGSEGVIKVVDFLNKNVVATFLTKIDVIYCIKYVPGKQSHVLVCGTNYQVEVWDCEKGVLVGKLKNRMFHTYVATFSFDGAVLATGHDSGVIQIWSTFDFTLIRTISLPKNVQNIINVIEIIKDANRVPSNDILSLSFYNDSNVLVAGTSEPSLEFIDTKYGQSIKKIKLDFPVSHVYSLCLSPDGHLLVCTGHERKAYVFCTDKARNMNSLKGVFPALRNISHSGQ